MLKIKEFLALLKARLAARRGQDPKAAPPIPSSQLLERRHPGQELSDDSEILGRRKNDNVGGEG